MSAALRRPASRAGWPASRPRIAIELRGAPPLAGSGCDPVPGAVGARASRPASCRSGAGGRSSRSPPGRAAPRPGRSSRSGGRGCAASGRRCRAGSSSSRRPRSSRGGCARGSGRGSSGRGSARRGPRSPGREHADRAHDQVDLGAGLRGLVELLDDLRVGDVVDLDPDPRVLAGGRRGADRADALDRARAAG